mmetsp:Transcript_10039/g.25091  ORF Transcript_10039/g.25091 Transcript_10039/m.25091 type:complete len:898 (+) Transcript_10039:65-2758(+)
MGNSDSHAAFVDGVKRLLVEDVTTDERDFWASLLSSPMSIEDIFEIIGPDHVRQLREKRPQNLQVFLRCIVMAMEDVCEASDEKGVLSAVHTTVANTTTRLLTRIVPFLLEDKEEGVVQDILWRPGGYQAPAEAEEASGDAEKVDACQEPVNEPANGGANGSSPAAAAPVVTASPSEASPKPPADGTPSGGAAAAAATPANLRVIGHDLLYHIGRYLFLPGYTVTPRTLMTGKDRGPIPTHRVDDRLVWKGGIGVSAHVSQMPAQAAFGRARCEVLRCVLACLSGPLFQSAEEYQEQPPRWLQRFTGGQVAYTATLFCSLMSSVFSYDPVGWGVPYGGLFSSQLEEDLVDVGLQVLCIVMDFDPRTDETTAPDAAGDNATGDSADGGNSVVQAKPDEDDKEYLVDNSTLQASSHGLGYRVSAQLEDLDPSKTALWGTTVRGKEEDGWLKVPDGLFLPMALQGKPVLTLRSSPEKKSKLRNVYRYMLQNIHKETEIDLVFGGIVRFLSTVHQANQTYLPNSRQSVGFYQEALVLLWHLLTLNPAFTRRVTDHLDTNQIVLPVLYLLQQAQNAPQLVGLLHTASFVLLVLSSERSFAVRLNEPYSGKIPLRIPTFQGCHADVVALTLYQVISDSLPRTSNDALVEMLLTVLCNISPYVKSFALESCLKLLGLVDRCARPSYLFRSAFTHHGLVFLVEMINNIVQYQFEGNSMLVYSVLRQKEVFEQLAALKLPPLGRRRRIARLGSGVSTPGADATGASKDGETMTPATSTSTPAGVDEEGAEDGDDGEWVATEEWLAGVKKKLPLQAISCLIEHMAPMIEGLCKQQDVTDQGEVLRFLRSTTMVGILPVPHPIVIRTYQASSYTAMWFTSYMWGVIFTRSQRMPLYDWKKIRLVVINQ